MGNDNEQVIVSIENDEEDAEENNTRIEDRNYKRVSYNESLALGKDENNNQKNKEYQNRNGDHEILSEGDEEHNNECTETKEKEASLLISNWITNLGKKLDFIFVNKPSELASVNGFKLDRDKRVCDPYISVSDDDIVLVRNAYDDDEVDKISGNCFVTLKNGEECLGYWRNGKRQGKGSITGTRLENLGIKRIFGDYMDGALTGLGKVDMADESWREGWFQHGYLHGPVKGMSKLGRLAWVGWYEAGLPVGICWQSVEGDGWLVGLADINGKLNGNDIAFLYPDLSSALIGRFKDGNLISAAAGRLVDTNLVDGIMEPVFRKDEEGGEYKFWMSSSEDITCPPHQRDVYESRVSEVRQSGVAGGGDGLFARIDVDPRVIVAFYNGLRWEPGGKGLNEDTGYAIYINISRTREERLKSEHMDIPKKYQNCKDYSATFAHKANHSFLPNCEFTTALHPCYGRVPALRTLVQMNAGEEFLVHYTMDMENAPDWYKQAWEALIFEDEMANEPS